MSGGDIAFGDGALGVREMSLGMGIAFYGGLTVNENELNLDIEFTGDYSCLVQCFKAREQICDRL